MRESERQRERERVRDRERERVRDRGSEGEQNLTKWRKKNEEEDKIF